MSYYSDKLASLRDIFGTDAVSVAEDAIVVAGRAYPVVDDVIVLLPPDRRPTSLRSAPRAPTEAASGFATDIQSTFGKEWTRYDAIMPEHESEFRRYFDLVDPASLAGARVCDLGCGNGRWSHFLRGRCREMVLVDFSEAIFVARRNLADEKNALFFMGDVRELPFRDDFVDFLFSLGVLHHLPTPCLDAVRALRRFAPRILCFLYYALDNRPLHFRLILRGVTLARRALCHIENERARELVARAGALCLYRPLVALGRLLDRARLGTHVPLYDFYRDRSPARIEQDVYDRFFTRIEQRVTRRQIMELNDSFGRVIVSADLPYWHFLCER